MTGTYKFLLLVLLLLFVFLLGFPVIPLYPWFFLHWKTLHFHKPHHCVCSVIYKDSHCLRWVSWKIFWLHFKIMQVKLSYWGIFFSPDNKNVWSQLEAVAPAGLESLESGCQVGLMVGGLCHRADGLYTYRRSSLATPLVQQLLPGSFMEQAWWQSWRRVPAPVRGNFVLQKGEQVQ